MRKCFCLLLALSGTFHVVIAQLPEFSFRHYTMDNGFPARSIYHVTQDKYGFIWCQADFVLIRYDGNTFRVYRHDDKDSFSLPPSKYYVSSKSSNGILLVAYQKGICYYDYATDGFKKLFPENLVTTPITGSAFGKENNIWYATQDKVLHHFDMTTGEMQTFAACKNSIASIFVDSRNIVWVGSHDGLYRFYPRENRYELYWRDSLHAVYGASMISGITEDETKTLWFTGFNSGIYSMDVNSKTIRFFDFKPVHWRKSDFFLLSHPLVHTINGHQYILANSGEGLVFLDPVTGNFSLLRHDPGNQNSLPSNDVQGIFYDNTETLWLATEKGISKAERMLPPFKTIHLNWLKKSKDNDTNEDENYSEIKVIYSDDQNNIIWIGTISGLFQYNLLQDRLVNQIAVRDKHSRLLEIGQLYMDKSHRLWIGTSAGVYIYEPATGKMISLAEQNRGVDQFAESEVSSNIIEDLRNNIWIGTENGISIYNQQLQFIKNLREEKDKAGSLLGQHVFAIYPKNDHEVWVATRVLNLYDYNTDSFVSSFSKNFTSSNSPSFIVEITKDDKGNCYFTTLGRVYIWNKATDSIYFPSFNTVIDQTLSKTFVDSKGKLWIASITEGLFKIDPDLNTISRFTIRNGLASNNLKNVWQSKTDGPVFLIRKDGFQYFYPDSIKIDTTRAPMRITGISILEKPLKADYQLFADSALSISYKQNVITFEFALMDYSFTDEISYQYKLEGFDDDWVNAASRRSATYTNLDAGNYVFRVRAKNHDNTDSGQAVVRLSVVPPFWKTDWFIALALLTLLFILYRWYAYLQKKFRAERIVNSFTASLYGQTTIEDMAWDIARNCISQLGFVDCIVYILDNEKNILVQKAACGPKNPVQREILNPIEISLGKGIVGSVAQSGIAEIINDTSIDKRYIVDDLQRSSEISVPIVADGNVYGVIDSEHPRKNFYTKQHLYLLRKIAAICSVRISKYITEDRLRTKIARDLHDELGSTLTSINIISKMALQQTNGNDAMSNNLQKIKDHSGYMMESMSDIVWAINPVNDTLDKIILRMKEFAAEISEPVKINYYFREEGLLDAIRLNLEQRKDIYLIFKEVLNNTVKYSGASEIHILLRADDNQLQMQIMDNGKGFDIEKNYSGNGLRNIRSRATQMRAELKIQSIPGTGSSILLQVPIT